MVRLGFTHQTQKEGSDYRSAWESHWAKLLYPLVIQESNCYARRGDLLVLAHHPFLQGALPAPLAGSGVPPGLPPPQSCILWGCPASRTGLRVCEGKAWAVSDGHSHIPPQGQKHKAIQERFVRLKLRRYTHIHMQTPTRLDHHRTHNTNSRTNAVAFPDRLTHPLQTPTHQLFHPSMATYCLDWTLSSATPLPLSSRT